MEKSPNTFWNDLKLRFSLLKVWFLKNIKVFIAIFVMVCIVCVFTGVIDSSTPVLGTINYPIFEPLAKEINQIIVDREIENLMTIFSIIISTLISIATFTAKLRRIAPSDIKDDKLKYALIQANLYFNQDGVLTKKIEKATGTDIDGDGKIDDKEIDISNAPKKGFIRNLVDAVKEFGVIMSADFTNGNTKDTVKEVVKEADLDDALDASNEINTIIGVGVNNIVYDATDTIIDDEVKNITSNDNMSSEEKVEKLSFLERLKRFFGFKKKDVHEELENLDKETEILENNVENDAMVNDEKKEEVKENSVSTNEKTPAEKKLSKKEEFIEKLKNRNK